MKGISLIWGCVLLLVAMWTNAQTSEHFSTETGHYGSKKYMRKAISTAFDHLKINRTVDEDEDLLYYFMLHDFDKDGFLDGHEMRVAFGDYDASIKNLGDVEKVVDETLEEDDVDGDGKISWEEYLASIKYHQKA